MITRENADSILNPYGFTVAITSGDKLQYNNCLSPNPGVHIIVSLTDNSFEIVYSPRHSIVELRLPPCSPLYEEIPRYTQFPKMFDQFMKYYNVIAQYDKIQEAERRSLWSSK